MPKRIVKQPVMIQREDKLVYPTVGEAFDFTSKEIEAINNQAPKALGLIVVNDAPVAAPVAAKADAVKAA